MNDTELRDRLATFYAEHWRALWSFIARMGGDRAQAEDIAQEAFAKWALSAAPHWDDRRAKSYLFSIAVRSLIDHKRRASRETRFAEAACVPGPEQAPDRPLAAGWASLSERDRQLLWLAHAEEFSHNEIAKILGVRTDSVKVMLSRARERARRKMGESDDPR